MPFIRESIVTTENADGTAHIAPLGVIEQGAELVIAPFRPSRTLDNLARTAAACVNATADVRLFAAAVTRRSNLPPVLPMTRASGWRLAEAVAHVELEVARLEDDAQRPRFVCRVVHEAVHRPWRGFNRAQAAVVEGAILVSRLSMLPAEKVDREMAYLQIAIDKTAAEAEREAWGWLLDAVAASRAV